MKTAVILYKEKIEVASYKMTSDKVRFWHELSTQASFSNDKETNFLFVVKLN